MLSNQYRLLKGQQQQKRRCFHWVHIFVCGLFFGWYYHANETSSAVPLNGTMHLIVSFYASWWGRGGGGGWV